MTEKLAVQGGAPVRTCPFPAWPIHGPEEEEAVVRVVQSGRWGRLGGTEVEGFEQAFARFHGSRYAIAVVNGTAAVKLALLGLGIEAGDEVIVPAYTFQATAAAVVEANAVPVFVDVHPDTYCLDPARLEEAITPRTRALVPVHIGGMAADMDPILAIARRHHVAVIEDAAQAVGGAYRGRMLGSLGDMGCFSFQASKNLNGGEGGMITTSDEGLERVCRSLHNCGRTVGAPAHSYEILGSNYRMTEFQGAILSCQLARLPEQNDRRNENGLYLNEHFSHIPGIRPLVRGVYGETHHPYHLYIFRYDPGIWGVPREAFLAALRAEGISCSPGYGNPLYAQPTFAEKRFGPYFGADGYNNDVAANATRCPVAERACRTEGCWLTQSLLLGTREDMDDIVRAVTKVYENRAALVA